MSQKDKETFKEHAQRQRELVAQITPSLEEKEMTNIFLKTLSSFYYECMIASAPSDFTEMINMGMRLEEGVREGWLSRDEAQKARDMVATLNFERKKVSFDPIPMSYVELYLSLVLKNLIQSRNPPQIPEPLPSWYKPELRWAFHQGAPGHDIENCYPLKYEVQNLMKSGMVSFEERAPNVKANPMPAHGNSSVNTVDACLGEFKVFDIRFIRRYLVQMHKDICMVSDCEHDHDGCVLCSANPRGYDMVKRDFQHLDEGMIQIVQSRHVGDDVNFIVPVFKQQERLVIQHDSSNNNNIN
ncbi:hypothetical protein KIW84_021221 [Lathyrus oleraceus]|uniref:Uncharacterized protein n=1 Tax=Pisum sativum TaxID=3888 RepID=A0A9D5B3M9_PEA|nr:hypothetical protein KIW84_021221 [Pisum sativum]